MTSATVLNGEHASISWALHSFALSKESRSNQPSHLYLDRANAEFGIIYNIAPGISVMADASDSDEPIYFQVSHARAVCSRLNQTCKKVCVLLQDSQLDLEFKTGEQASGFTQVLCRLANKVGNLDFEVFEAPSMSALNNPDFRVEDLEDARRELQSRSVSLDVHESEWAKIYKANKCSDFTIYADKKPFPVHRVLLCTRSQYFNAVCDGRFAETYHGFVTLPEPAPTVSTMLKELYGVYNSTTGSIFTAFATRAEIEKETIMSDLMALFIACDKYNLESIKKKVAESIIDRLPFIHDVLVIIDLASHVFGELYPDVDCGLRKEIIAQVQLRLPSIMEDESAWELYSENKTLLKAVHECQFAGIKRKRDVTPTIKKGDGMVLRGMGVKKGCF